MAADTKKNVLPELSRRSELDTITLNVVGASLIMFFEGTKGFIINVFYKEYANIKNLILEFDKHYEATKDNSSNKVYKTYSLGREALGGKIDNRKNNSTLINQTSIRINFTKKTTILCSKTLSMDVEGTSGGVTNYVGITMSLDEYLKADRVIHNKSVITVDTQGDAELEHDI